MKKIIILIYMIAVTAVTFFVSLETAASTSIDNRHVFEQFSETNSIKQEETIFQVSLGNNHSLALTSSSRLFSWGRNDNGQLGDGTAIDTHTHTIRNHRKF
jgi:alpha-tubulin suppressor-like RCC1 family protein